ncbi:MAG: Type II secretion system protein F [Pseudomonas fluorescens]|nr:MAG: Type II secretion system protein F [Pseudomonas fluorescens]
MKAASTLYAWEGTNHKGRKVSGHLHGHSPALIRTQLRRQGINPGRIRKKTMGWPNVRPSVNAADIALFTRQLATLLHAGIPLLQALDILGASTENPHLRPLIEDLKQQIASGSSLSEALRKQPHHFDDLYCNLVAAGEQAGALDTLLERVATHLERSARLKAGVRKAMTYPMVIMAVATVVSALLLIQVVPQFQGLFSGIGATLPAFTLLVISLSEFTQDMGWAVLAGAAAGFFGVRRAYATCPVVKHWLDVRLLKAPLAGALLTKTAVARFSRTLSTTFAAGVPLLQALDSVAGATGNEHFKQAITQIRKDVSIGMQLAASGIFPPMAVQMTAIGEESGTLDSMLARVANHYEADVDNLVDNLTVIPPFLVLARSRG